MHDSPPAIGIFDSGVGGLTVTRRIMERLPHESIVYLGDTARVPYGTKSAETVIRYAHSCASILLKQRLKLLVVACNTASSCALPSLTERLSVPVLGVIEPGARAAVASTRNGHIGVIGTAGTIASAAYPNAIHAALPTAAVYSKACPLFVPLAEEGWTEGQAPQLIAQEYLAELKAKGIDTLVLGCTHYPLLKSVIAQAMGEDIRLVDSATETAQAAEEILRKHALLASATRRPRHRFLVSDDPNRFAAVGRRFLAHDLHQVEWVDF